MQDSNSIEVFFPGSFNPLIIDIDDYHVLAEHNWRHDKRRNRVLYRRGVKTTVFLHRVIIKTPINMITDHINGNKMDNRKSNLRICSSSQNNSNRGVYKYKKTSKYKGVTFFKRDKTWQAKICKNKTIKHLGYFETEDQAANAYNNAVDKHHGIFGFKNIID